MVEISCVSGAKGVIFSLRTIKYKGINLEFTNLEHDQHVYNICLHVTFLPKIGLQISYLLEILTLEYVIIIASNLA